MKLQFSLKQSLILMTTAAIGCAALAKPSYFVASAVLSLVLALLGVSIVAAIVRRGESRAFWASFAFFGWAHMILALGPWFYHHTEGFLISRQLLDILGKQIGHDRADLTTMASRYGRHLPWDLISETNFDYLTYVVIGQSLISVALAYVGGLVGYYLYTTRDERS